MVLTLMCKKNWYYYNRNRVIIDELSSNHKKEEHHLSDSIFTSPDHLQCVLEFAYFNMPEGGLLFLYLLA